MFVPHRKHTPLQPVTGIALLFTFAQLNKGVRTFQNVYIPTHRVTLGIATGCVLCGRGSNSTKGKCSHLYNAQTGSEAHRTSYPMSTVGGLPEGIMAVT
jgi:hypothetical protein